jgi:hypothetical protein
MYSEVNRTQLMNRSRSCAAGGGVGGATDGKAFRERLEREVAFWGPELKKLGIAAE